MVTKSKYRKRKLTECEDIKDFKLPKNLDGLENQEIYATFNYMKSEKSDFLDTTQEEKMLMKTELKDHESESKQNTKIGFVFCEFCHKNIKDTNFKKHFAQHNRTKTCEKCLHTFTKNGIQRHSCKIFICETRGRNYRNRSKFESHLRNHTLIEERKFLTCKICNKKIERYGMKQHVLTHTAPCSKCGKLIRKDRLPSHFKIHFKYACDKCGETSSSKESHNRHLKIHKIAMNPCPECDESFQYLVELARHITKAHRQIEDGKIECPFCKKTYSAIGHHLRTHEENPKQCEKCNAVLLNYSAYKAHMRFHEILSSKGCDRVIIPRHLEKKAVCRRCNMCDKLFPSQNTFIQHYKSHVEFITRPCPYCPMNSFSSLIDLMKHISEVHTDLPKGCEICLICSEVVSNIDDHISIHKPDRFVCEICSITFPTKMEINKHNTRHHKMTKKKKTSLHVLMEKYATPKLNFKKVPCFMCSQKIRISHMRSHLSFHQMFKCISCQKSFSNQKFLELHEDLHNKFSQRCPGCNQYFISHIRLLAHLKMCHKMAFSTSKACPRCKI